MQLITKKAAIDADFEENKNIIKWTDVNNWNSFKSKFRNIAISSSNVAFLLHEMQDAGVPIFHSPANLYITISDHYNNVSKFREFRFESGYSGDLYGQLNNDFNNLPLEGKYFTKPFTKVLLNKEIVVEESLEEIYNNMIEEFLLLTQNHVQKWKDRFGDERWLEIDYDGLQPFCRDAAFTLSREILYLFLLCKLHDAWDNPNKVLTKKTDMTPIINLLLN